MRGLWVIAALVGCGRYHFDAERTSTDASADGVATGDAMAPGWTRLRAGDQTTCGLYQGRAYCWGGGTNYAIGDGTAVNRPSPSAVALPAGTVTDIAQGQGHGCAIVDGAAYCWGNAPPGNGGTMAMSPVPVSGLPSPVTTISAGASFTCAVAAGGVYCWGADSGGALGNGATTATQLTPVPVTLPGSAISLDAGNDHVLAQLSTGDVYGWGHNDGPGALCTGASTTTYDTPTITMINGTQPALAGWHACAIVNGAAQCWGLGTSGELGDGLATSSTTPRAVTGMASGVTALDAGGGPTDLDATCAVAGGVASCWGKGNDGRLGNGSTNDALVPAPVQGLPSDIVEVALGFNHSCARSADGTVRCWGRNDAGQLGDGSTTGSPIPVVVPLPP
jgi:serine/threonine-protein kinase